MARRWARCAIPPAGAVAPCASLLTSKREDIIRNIVEQVLAYALCRKLEVYDRSTVDAIAKTIDQSDGSWEDLFLEVALSLPFQETRLPEIAN